MKLQNSLGLAELLSNLPPDTAVEFRCDTPYTKNHDFLLRCRYHDCRIDVILPKSMLGEGPNADHALVEAIDKSFYKMEEFEKKRKVKHERDLYQKHGDAEKLP